MQVIEKIDLLRKEIARLKKTGKTVGFVPTMGFLHEGHMSLVRASKVHCDVTVVSIFVNPTQFGPTEDLAKYPRDMKRDTEMLSKEGTDIVFAPSVDEMYPEPEPRTYVEVPELGNKLCGVTRPTHFRGVTTVVAKLFNIVCPDKAFFGKKDYQQYVIIQKMVRDLDMPVDIIGCDIVREPDGLAMSSRNTYLAPAERKAALVLSMALRSVDVSCVGKSATDVEQKVRSTIAAEPLARIDYVVVVDQRSLDPVTTVVPGTLVALAVFIGKTRLIDNKVIGS